MLFEYKRKDVNKDSNSALIWMKQNCQSSHFISFM